MKGLHCNILTAKDFPDCSLDGLSSRVSCVTLVDPPQELFPLGLHATSPIRRLVTSAILDAGALIFAPDEKAPAVVLRKICFGGTVSLHAVPLELADQQTCMGGTFIWSCDSRFPLHFGGVRAPIPLHDRLEGSRDAD